MAAGTADLLVVLAVPVAAVLEDIQARAEEELAIQLGVVALVAVVAGARDTTTKTCLGKAVAVQVYTVKAHQVREVLQGLAELL